MNISLHEAMAKMGTPTTIHCPECGSKLKADKAPQDGARIRCPQCRASFLYEVDPIELDESVISDHDSSSTEDDDLMPSQSEEYDWLEDASLDEQSSASIRKRKTGSGSKASKNGKSKKPKRHNPYDHEPGILSRAVVASVMMLGLLVIVGTYLWYRSHQVGMPLPVEQVAAMQSLFEERAQLVVDQESRVLEVKFSGLELAEEDLRPLTQLPDLKSLTFVDCEFSAEQCMQIIHQLKTLKTLRLEAVSGITREQLAPLESLAQQGHLELAVETTRSE